MKKVIVCTTIFDTPELNAYSQMKGWEFIVVNDLKTPPLSLKNAEILTVEDQKKLPYQICKVIPWNCVQRRNIGYMHALANGADVIATVDNDNNPLDNWGFDLLGTRATAKTVKGTPFFDIVRHVTDDVLWHRGTLYEDLRSRQETVTEETEVLTGVQANLWLGEPDTDGICRLTRDMELGKERIARFQGHYSVGKGTFSPYDTQNMAFLSRFAVSALLPVGGVCNREHDIWSSYVTERLMWETDYQASFGTATVRQDRNVHDRWVDIRSEISFSSIVNRLLPFLRSLSLPAKFHRKYRVYMWFS